MIKYITIAALCGCVGLMGWAMVLKASNATLRADLKAERSALAVCKADALNQLEHEERKNEVDATLDTDLGSLIHPDWMLP